MSQVLVETLHKVQWHTYPMPHSVHPAEIDDIGQFLRAVLAPDSAWGKA